MKRKLEQVIEFGKADPWENPEEGLDELIEKEKESTNQDEDEHAAEERDQAQAQISQWEDANDPETAKVTNLTGTFYASYCILIYRTMLHL